jgi:hypothetical protein
VCCFAKGSAGCAPDRCADGTGLIAEVADEIDLPAEARPLWQSCANSGILKHSRSHCDHSRSHAIGEVLKISISRGRESVKITAARKDAAPTSLLGVAFESALTDDERKTLVRTRG